MRYFFCLTGALLAGACSHQPSSPQAAAASTPIATQTCAESFNASVDRLVYALQTQNGISAE